MKVQLKRKAEILEKSFVVVALLLFTSPFTAILPPDHNSIELGIFSSVYIVTIFFVRNNIRDILLLAKREKFLICLLLITTSSAIWSDFPLITFRRNVSLIGTTLFGMYLAKRYALKDQLHMLGVMLGIVAIFSLLFVLFLPFYGLSSDHEGAWQGIYDQKNVLGHIMALSSLVFFLLCIEEEEFRSIKWALFILILLLLIRSQSMTSISMTLIMFCFMFLYKSLQWGFYPKAALFCLYAVLVVGIVILISENQNFILNIMGRDSDLSGRVELWESIIPILEKRLFLGHGYNAFWIEGGTRGHIWYLVGWETPHSHNGFLDVWLDVGLVGVFALGLSLLQAFHNSIKYVKQKYTWEALWPLVYLTSLLLFNFLESGLLRHNNLYWVLYVSLIMSYYRNI